MEWMIILITIYRRMSHPLFLLVLIVGGFLVGGTEPVFGSVLVWLLINLIFGKSLYFYK